MAVKWTTVLIGALRRKSNVAVTQKTHERTPQICFRPLKRKSRFKPAKFFLRTPRALAASLWIWR
jgi:hypothetical protein